MTKSKARSDAIMATPIACIDAAEARVADHVAQVSDMVQTPSLLFPEQEA